MSNRPNSIAESARSRASKHITEAGEVTLVEDEIDNGQNRGETITEFVRCQVPVPVFRFGSGTCVPLQGGV